MVPPLERRGGISRCGIEFPLDPLTLVRTLIQGIFRVIVYEPALQLASAQYTVRTIVKSRPIQSLRSPNSEHHNPHADLLKMLFWTVLGF